ncbi:MAG: hypothetical protein M3065_13370 [Actinomycetota bacterium]|nr:hypothetical protein [Actinomycetota bacterium]
MNPSTARSAGCQKGPGCATLVGLLSIYTHNTQCRGNPIDPLNVIWWGAAATPSNVEWDLDQYTNWGVNDNSVSIGPFGFDLDFDPQAVRESLTLTNPPGHAYPCHGDDGDRATNQPWTPDRDHVRLFATQEVDNGGPHWVVGDAHRDHSSTRCAVVAVGVNLPGVPRFFHKHESTSFDGPRDVLYAFWGPVARRHYDYWGNTAPTKNCDGNRIRSNGHVAAREARPSH